MLHEILYLYLLYQYITNAHQIAHGVTYRLCHSPLEQVQFALHESLHRLYLTS